MSRSLNKVTIIGNLTRDPELRYTPQGTAVCSFGVATNRQWVTDGEKKEEAEFHNIIVWAGLAEIAAKYLTKGRQVYVEGRISTRDWETQTGEKRRTTEIVASDIIFLSGGGPLTAETDQQAPREEVPPQEEKSQEQPKGTPAKEQAPDKSAATPPTPAAKGSKTTDKAQKSTKKQDTTTQNPDQSPASEKSSPKQDEDDIPF